MGISLVRRVSLLALFGLCLSVHGEVSAQEWEEVDRNAGAKIYAKEVADSGLDKLRGVITLPFTPAQVATVMMNIEEHPTFIEEIDRIKVLAEERKDSGRKVTWVYQTTDVSVLSDRDAVIRVETWSVGDGASKVFHSTFENGTYPKAPALRDGVVRIPRLKGYWVARPTKGGKATRFEYVFHAEVGGSVPDFLVRGAQVDNITGILNGLNRRCRAVFGKTK
jgi:hypothetical protein